MLPPDDESKSYRECGSPLDRFGPPSLRHYTRVRSADSETPISESVQVPPPKARGAHDVSAEELHPGICAQTLA